MPNEVHAEIDPDAQHAWQRGIDPHSNDGRYGVDVDIQVQPLGKGNGHPG